SRGHVPRGGRGGRAAAGPKRLGARWAVAMRTPPRHEAYIREIRGLGTRLKLIQDCDISGAIACCLPERDIDLLYGVGGAPEAVLAAAAGKCFGGRLLGPGWPGRVLRGPGLAEGQPAPP